MTTRRAVLALALAGALVGLSHPAEAQTQIRISTAAPDNSPLTAAFRTIQEAYEVLTDPLRRRDYDDRLGIHSRTMAGAAGGGPAWSGRDR